MNHRRTPLTVAALIAARRDALRLDWEDTPADSERVLPEPGGEPERAPLVGVFNPIRPSPIQVLGSPELTWLAGLGRNSRRDTLSALTSPPCLAVLIADALSPPADLLALARERGIGVVRSPASSLAIVNKLLEAAGDLEAERITLHGVFMEVLGTGVLLTGDCGVGKSELALELISRGHRLIADDAPEFLRVGPDQLLGRCPHVLAGFLEVRGLGILDIRAMYGDSAIKPTKYLRLILSLVTLSNDELRDIDRLQGTRRVGVILGVSVPEITLPVAPGRSLAVLIEAAVRDHILRARGIAADEVLAERQREQMARPEPV